MRHKFLLYVCACCWLALMLCVCVCVLESIFIGRRQDASQFIHWCNAYECEPCRAAHICHIHRNDTPSSCICSNVRYSFGIFSLVSHSAMLMFKHRFLHRLLCRVCVCRGIIHPIRRNRKLFKNTADIHSYGREFSFVWIVLRISSFESIVMRFLDCVCGATSLAQNNGSEPTNG